MGNKQSQIPSAREFIQSLEQDNLVRKHKDENHQDVKVHEKNHVKYVDDLNKSMQQCLRTKLNGTYDDTCGCTLPQFVYSGVAHNPTHDDVLDGFSLTQLRPKGYRYDLCKNTKDFDTLFISKKGLFHFCKKPDNKKETTK